MFEAERFITESNSIEGIRRPPTPEEINEFKRFMSLKKVTIEELIKFVSVYQPSAKLRDKKGMNVIVGGFLPIEGGPHLTLMLGNLLHDINNGKSDPFVAHLEYEKLHPFSDCNGRSGRMLWAWGMGHAYINTSSIGFLQKFYYQTLEQTRI